MSDYIVALPPEAYNIEPNMATFERSGKDGNEVIMPFFGGDNFVGEVLSGKWVKNYESGMLGPVTQLISGGELQITAKAAVAGSGLRAWSYCKNEVLLVDGTVIDVHLKLPSHSTVQSFRIAFHITPQEPSSTAPVTQDDMIEVQIWTTTTTYYIKVRKKVSGTTTTLLSDTAITNAEGTFRIKFNEDKLGYTNFYFHDGSGSIDESADEVTDSPFNLDVNFNHGYCGFTNETFEATNRTVVSEGVTVTYPFGSNLSQLVKYDVPRGDKVGVETVFYEAEDETLGGGADTEDLDDDSGTSARLNAQNEYARKQLNPISDTLSHGRYLVLFRIKDTAQVTNDLYMSVYNSPDATYLNDGGGGVTTTATGTWKVYQLPFTVNADDDGDLVYLYVSKKLATANTIYVDWIRVIPYDGMNGRCKCFDTMGEASEDDWMEVFDPDHNFVGDCVIENGLIRLWIDEMEEHGAKFYAWDGTAWLQVMNRVYIRLQTSALYMEHPSLRKIVSLTSEEIKITVCAEDTAVKNNDHYVVYDVAIKRSLYALEFEVLEVYPIQQYFPYMGNNPNKNFGYAGDAETDKITHFDLSIYTVNDVMTDNFGFCFDEDGDPFLAGLTTNLEPTSNIGFAYYGGLQVCNPPGDGRKFWFFYVPFSRVVSLFAEAEDETITASARTNLDGDGADTCTENDGVWAAVDNCVVDENVGGGEESVGSVCTEITSSGAGDVRATCTPGAPLGNILKFDDLKLYMHRDGALPASVYVELLSSGGSGNKRVFKFVDITASATEYTIALPHSATDLQGWTQDGFDFATFTHIRFTWTAAGAGEIVYIDGLHNYIGTTTSRGRGETLSGSSAVVCDAQNEQSQIIRNPITNYLPPGRYLYIIRAKDTDQVANDLLNTIHCWSGSPTGYLNEENENSYKTLTSSFAYYQGVFTIVDGNSGVTFYAQKDKATENTMFIDYFLIVPIGDGESWPQDLAHNAMRKKGTQRKVVDRRD